MVGADRRRIINRLPFIGLDIESVSANSVRVEYSPNRPDFGTDFGIARALRGLLGEQVGLPNFPIRSSGITVSVDKRLASIRPYIACVVATGLRLGDEGVRQIISLQEDLHNGLGRKRKVVAIGLHNLDAISPPLSYRGVGRSFKFIPLGRLRPMTIESILSDIPEGQAYGGALPRGKSFPVIEDNRRTVLSFPPIINGSATEVTPRTKNLFVDVTSTNQKAGEDVLAIMATTLAEAGGRLASVGIRYARAERRTPDLTPSKLPLDRQLVKSVLGIDLTREEIFRSLAKSRLGLRGTMVLAPRYRVDLLHPVDIAEEVALGYGFDRIRPVYPPSERPGSFNPLDEFLDSAATVMAGEGMIEMMTYELTDGPSLYSNFGRSSPEPVRVQNPKSLEHSILRDSLLPTMMASLSGNVKSDYPQRIFEIGRVYTRSGPGVSEAWHLGCCIAHSQASFTEAKMYLEAACRTIIGKEVSAVEGEHWAFVEGRCARVSSGSSELGFVGEMTPSAITAFGLGVPVSGFELDLTRMFELLK